MKLKERLKKYENTKAVNQSLLKALKYYGRYALEEREEKESKALLKGSLVDMLVLNKEDFSDFFIVNDNSYTPTQKSLLEAVSSASIETDEELLQVLDELGFRKNWKPNTRLKEAKKILDKFLEDYIRTKELIPVSEEDYLSSVEVAKSINENTNVLKNLINEAKNVVTQADIYAQISEVPVKGLVDLIIEKDDEVIIVDLKTFSGNIDNLLSNIKKYDYVFQLHFYKMILNKAYDIPIEKIRTVILGASTTLKDYVLTVEIPHDDEKVEEILSSLEDYKTYVEKKQIKYLYLHNNNYKFYLKKTEESYEIIGKS